MTPATTLRVLLAGARGARMTYVENVDGSWVLFNDRRGTVEDCGEAA